MMKILLIMGCLCLASASATSPPSYVPPGMGPTVSPPSYLPPGAGSTTSLVWSNPDWLSDDVGLVAYYGPYGYPFAVGLFDDRILYDEWYPVARSFLDGTIYSRYYYDYSQSIYLDGSWWRDSRGYRPLYRIKSGFDLEGT